MTSRTEPQIQRALADLARGLVEQGRPGYLIAANGLYSRLHQGQGSA